MKTTVLLAILVLFVSMAVNAGALEGAPHFKSGSEPDGFRGIKWGTDIKTLKGMTKVGTDPSYGGIDRYIKKDEELQIGGAQLSEIFYGFWQQQFFSVTIEAIGYSNCMSLKDATVEKFGPGFKGNEVIERYGWFGPITSMKYDYSKIDDDCSLYMSSQTVHEAAAQYKRQKTIEGAEKDF